MASPPEAGTGWALKERLFTGAAAASCNDAMAHNRRRLPGGDARVYPFEWEREWRVVGDFSFAPADAAFLIIPENLHEAARVFFDDAGRENIGPNYTCKFIDPYWTDETTSSVLPA